MLNPIREASPCKNDLSIPALKNRNKEVYFKEQLYIYVKLWISMGTNVNLYQELKASRFTIYHAK